MLLQISQLPKNCEKFLVDGIMIMEQILQSKSVLTLQSEPRIYLAAFKKNVLNRSLQSYAALNILFDNLLMSHPFVKRSS